MTRAIHALLRSLRAVWRRGRLALDRGAARTALRLMAGRRGEPEALPRGPRPPPGAAFDVIYAIGYWPGTPKRYRVFNLAEGLQDAGYRIHVMAYDRLDDIRRYRWRAHALVLFRAEYDRLVGIKHVLAYAGSIGMAVVYDIDDLVFDPALADRIDGLRHVGRYERRAYLRSMERMRRLLLLAARVTVSTASLAARVAALGRPVAVLANSLNGEQLRLAAEIAAAGPPARDGVIVVGYFSGSPTHQRDFAECEAALLAVLARRPELRFRVVGYLDLGPAWQPYAGRIERIGFLPALAMLRALAGVDINLAPLELGNPFCEAKSELKFFEAALVGVPTVASATTTFAAAIEHGVSGYLARGPEQWEAALDELAALPAHRAAVGTAARARALARFALPSVTPQAIAALGLAPPRRAAA